MSSTGGPDRTSALGVLIGLVVVVVLGVVVVNSSGGGGSSAGTATSSPGEAASVSPLTGQGAPGNAVLAVKIDNSPDGRPWDGVEDADVVYVEPVEGGITRLLAVFASRLPARVGPVRSFRETDLGVLAAYGRPALAFSGNAPELDGLLASAPVLPVSPVQAGGAYARGDRPPPHNLYADPAALLAAAPDAAAPSDVGFVFGAAPDGGTPAPETTATVGNTPVTLRWDADASRFTIGFGGTTAMAGGRPAVAATVVVQRVAIGRSAITDVAGSPSPTVSSVGEGAVDVLRDGRSYPGRWSRPAQDAPTTYTGADGAPLDFAPGPVWVLFVAA